MFNTKLKKIQVQSIAAIYSANDIDINLINLMSNFSVLIFAHGYKGYSITSTAIVPVVRMRTTTNGARLELGANCSVYYKNESTLVGKTGGNDFKLDIYGIYMGKDVWRESY